MSDDSEPGEIKSPEIPSSIVRAKRSIDHDRRYHKVEKRLRLERDLKESRERDDYKRERRDELKRDDDRRVDMRRDDQRREDIRREDIRRDDIRHDDIRREELRRDDIRRDDRKQNFNNEECVIMGREDLLRLKERVRLKESEKLKNRAEDDKLRNSKEEKLKEEIRQVSEELRLKKKDKSPSAEKKEKKKDPEKKKKKDKESKKVKEKVSKNVVSEKYEKLLKEKLSEQAPQSPDEVSVGTSTSTLLDKKKRSVLEDSSESSELEATDEEIVELVPSPVPRRLTPSPSPPPDPLAGLPPYYPALQGCRNVDHFEYLNRIEEGTYGVVFRARDKRTNQTVALKKLKMEKEKQGFPITSLREINTLLKGQHENVVHVREIVVGSNMDKIYIVMDYIEHDLKSLMENMKEQFLVGEVKTIMRQLCNGLAYLHDNWIIHRDIKTSNLLFSHAGMLKIGDFGLAREYGSPLKQYTEVVVTLWYRAPELLLGCKLYSVPIDVWSAGCVFGELLGQKPLFPGKSEIDQLNKIFKELGTPNDKIWPGWSELPATQRVSFANHPYNQLRNRFPPSQLTERGFNLLNSLLCYDPVRRITALSSISHSWYKEAPLPVDPAMFPTWPAKSEMNANPNKKKHKSPTPPSGGGAADKLENSGFKFLSALQGTSAKGPGFSLKF